LNGHGEDPTEDQLHLLGELQVSLHPIDVKGLILDIGGGGEGVIGILNSTQVVAVDRSKRELEESPAGPLKIVMDATDLQFLDSSFSAATAFFALMYVPDIDLRAVLREASRVLRPGGDFLIWDVAIPERGTEPLGLVAIRVLAKLPKQEIRTGYGVKWPSAVRDAFYYSHLAEEVGFRTMKVEERDGLIVLELRKPG
jgi:ubiquinone/menaquinone biosynthesis C-methylase UbiE